MTTRYRKRPIVVEALEFDGSPDSADEVIAEWPRVRLDFEPGTDAWTGRLAIDTLEGTILVEEGDFVIKRTNSDSRAYALEVCKPDIFAATYAPIGDSEKDLAARIKARIATALPASATNTPENAETMKRVAADVLQEEFSARGFDERTVSALTAMLTSAMRIIPATGASSK